MLLLVIFDSHTSKEAENPNYKAMSHKYLHLQYSCTWISALKGALHCSSHTFQSLQHKLSWCWCFLPSSCFRKREHISAFTAWLLLGSLKHHLPVEPGTEAIHKSFTGSDSKSAKITGKSISENLNYWQSSSREIFPSHPTAELSGRQALIISKYHRSFRKELQIVLTTLSFPIAYILYRLVAETFISVAQNNVFLNLFHSLHYCRKRNLFLRNVLGLPNLFKRKQLL